MINARFLIELFAGSLLAGTIAAYFLLFKPALATQRQLRTFQAEAEAATTRGQLQIIQGRLIQFARRHCWHNWLLKRAEHIDQFIKGRLNGINNKTPIA